MSEESKLPGSLADQILDLEFALESGTLTEVKLGELLAAYSEAIGHFYTLKDQRSKFYEEKLKRLFLNEQVKGLIGESSNAENAENGSAKQTLRQESRRISRKVEEAAEVASEQAQMLLQRFETSHSNNAQRITRELSHQKENIMQRLQARSSSRAKQPKVVQVGRRRQAPDSLRSK